MAAWVQTVIKFPSCPTTIRKKKLKQKRVRRGGNRTNGRRRHTARENTLVALKEINSLKGKKRKSGLWLDYSCTPLKDADKRRLTHTNTNTAQADDYLRLPEGFFFYYWYKNTLWHIFLQNPVWQKKLNHLKSEGWSLMILKGTIWSKNERARSTQSFNASLWWESVSDNLVAFQSDLRFDTRLYFSYWT